MSKRKGYVFVLWSDHFEELAATVFVTQLREAGLRVKLISLTRRRITGVHGLALLPDFTLEQVLALASRAIGVIIPCGLLGSKQLENDPRLAGFFRQAYESGAQFVIGQIENLTDTELFPPSMSQNLTIYPDGEDLVAFARQMAKSLSLA